MKIKHQRERIEQEYRHRSEELSPMNRQLTYPNQKEAAFDIMQHFIQGKSNVCLIAQPGTGKTGTALEVLYSFATHPDDEICMNTEDMLICSGMSDCDWKKQFEISVLPSFRKNIFHRGNLSKQSTKLSQMRNGIIIPDECHIASGTNMTVSNTLRGAGLLNISVIENRNMKKLDISATPESVLHDLDEWDNKAAVVILQPGPLYKGFALMLSEDRIRKAVDLTTYEATLELLQSFDQRFATTTKKYFPFRITKANIKAHIQRASVELRWDTPLLHDSSQRIEDVDELMHIAPSKHRVIFVKGFWRASKRLVRNHVGGSYVPIPKKRDTTSAAQDLVARFCDNYEYIGDELNPNLRPIHYCDKAAVEEYLDWFENGCDYSNTDYTAPRIKSKNGLVRAKRSVNHFTNIDDLDGTGTERSRRYDLSSATFSDVATARVWCRETLVDGYGSSEFRIYDVHCLLVRNNTQHGTCFMYRDIYRQIELDDVTRRSTDLGYGISSSARIMPVYVIENDSQNIRYIVIYSSNKLRVIE